MNENFVVKWRCPDQPNRGVYLLGLKPDGVFHGDMNIFFDTPTARGARGVGITAMGQLSPEDYSRFCQLVTQLPASPPPNDAATICNGYLLKGRPGIGKPLVRAYYLQGPVDAPSQQFLQLIEILTPYLVPFFQELEDVRIQHTGPP